ADAATHRIDTTHTTPHELRSKMREFAGVEPGLGPVLQFESFGYKHGTPLDADFVFDVRCLPNPHWEATLREQTGLDGPVIEFLEGHDTVTEMIDSIDQFISRWLPRFTAEQRSYITVAVGCTGGLHRSVFVAE
ncbi:MAG: RNase adaptor protein RapZ, partial [Actinobacteria bacterium]|nr:RNase adaptor protein RapZ [Actinomycetota bacterium]NIS35198.1 RNase adaptor protein RapZ [Actinomycetota bacterium]NIU69915.1 RNase adaptor protein RapZ [Actinomycetota bacterium]